MHLLNSSFVYVFGAQVISGVFYLASLALLARLLGAERFGVFALFRMLGDFFFLVCIGWSSAAVARYGSEEMTTEGRIIKTFISRSILLCFSLLVVAAVVFYFPSFLSSFVKWPQPSLSLLLLFYILTSSFSDFIRNLLQACSQFKALSLQKIMESSLFFFTLLGWGLTHGKATPQNMAMLWCLSMLFAGLLGFFFLKKKYFFPVTFSLNYFRRVFSFSFPVIFLSLMGYCVNWIDIFVIRLYLTPKDIGIYHAAYSLLKYVDQAPATLHIVLVPLFVQHILRKDTELVSFFINRLLAQWIFIFSFFVLFFFMFGKFLIGFLFGMEFYASFHVLVILLSCAGMRLYAASCGPVFNAFEMTRTATLLSMIIAFSNIALDFLLVPFFGIFGAALATGFSFLLSFFLYAIFLRQRLHTGNFLPLFAFAPVLCAAFYAMKAQEANHALLAGLISCLALFIFTKFLRVFSDEDSARISSFRFSKPSTLLFSFFYLIFNFRKAERKP